MSLMCTASIHAVYTTSLSQWLIDWCWVLCKLQLLKTETTTFAVAVKALLPVWCGISSVLSVEVATTMDTSCCSEWDKAPVKNGHASSLCLLKWEVLLSLRTDFVCPVPLSFSIIPCFWRRKCLKGLPHPSKFCSKAFLFLFLLLVIVLCGLMFSWCVALVCIFVHPVEVHGLGRHV